MSENTGCPSLRRIASLSLSDSSKTLSPEPQAIQTPPTHITPLVEKMARHQSTPRRRDNRQPAPINSRPRVASSNSQRNRDIDAERPLATRGRSRGFELLLNNARIQSMKVNQIIDLEDEVIEVRPINLDTGSVIDVEELESELEQDIFQASVNEQTYRRVDDPQIWSRNPAIRAPLRKIDTATGRRGACLGAGDTVELTDGRFLEITVVVENVQTRAVTLRGWELRRTSDLAGELIFKLNELCYMIEVDLDDPRPMHLQSVIEVGLDKAKKIRALTRTNYHFPAYRFDLEALPSGDQDAKKIYVLDEEGLVVRWQHITIFHNAKDRMSQLLYSANYQSRKLVRLDEKRCDNDHYLPACVLRYQWREDERLTRNVEKDESAEATDLNIQKTLTGNAMRPACIDVSDDEITILPEMPAFHNTTNTRVSIDISASDFTQADPQKFMENIRRRFEAQVSLSPEEAPAIPQTTKYDTTKVGRKTRKPARPDRPGMSNTRAGHQYSYGDACRSPTMLRN